MSVLPISIIFKDIFTHCAPVNKSTHLTARWFLVLLKTCQGEKMVSDTQKTRSSLLLFVSFTQSVLPSLPLLILTILTTSLLPALALADLRILKTTTPLAGDTNKSSMTLPAEVLKPSSAAQFSDNFSVTTIIPFSLSKTSITTPANLMLSTSTVAVPHFSQTSPRDVLITSPIAAANTLQPSKVSLNPYPVLCHPGSQVPLPLVKQISRLLARPCKHLTLSLKAVASPLHKYLQSPLSKMSLYPVSSEKVPLQPTPPKSLFSSASTSLPNALSSSLPQTLSNKIPSPLISKTSLLPLSKTLSIPVSNISSSPSGQTRFHQSRHPPPPSLPHTTGPLFEDQPFIVSWNIPDLVCNRYNISLDTSPFKGVATPAKIPGQFLSLFYTNRLGLYPHINLTSRKLFYGGIPQRSNLKVSMNKARADIDYYIPSRTSGGLAVIDWEEWRPLWVRNWGTKKIYQTLSVNHVMQRNRSLTLQQATEKAKQQFQAAARRFMSGMLAMGRSMRPNYLWGFYMFPNCYNYDWLEPDYTGQCSKEVRRQNDELLWLWESSTALYPSVYLQASLADNPRAALMVRNRVHEALRVSALHRQSVTAPVYVYTRPVFVDQNRRFLSQGDLVRTIGESAAMGASGSVLWGASADYDDQTSCETLSSYLSSTINPYITNVTAAAQLCSNFLCQGNGRCVRKTYNSSHYLHLNPKNFRVIHVRKRYLVLGRPTFADLKTLSRRFTCQCYKGLSCTPRTNRELAKALEFSVKQGLYQKTHALNKAVLDDLQQTSISKDNVKKNLKV